MEKIDHEDERVVSPRVVNPREPVTCGRTAGFGLGRAQGTRRSRVPASTFPGKAMVELTSSSLLRLKPFQHCSGVGGGGNFAQLGTRETRGSQLSPASAVGPSKSPQLATEITSRRRIRIIFPSSFFLRVWPLIPESAGVSQIVPAPSRRIFPSSSPRRFGLA